MKKITLIVLTLFSFLASSKAIAQQGFGTNQPDKSAAVDIVSSKRGLLIPRLELTSTAVAAPVSSPAVSLLVYNTATAGDVTPGYYYWDGANWVRFVSATTEKTVTVSAGENVTVSSSTTGNTTDYEVAVAGGGTDGQVLVTRIVGGVTTTVWVDPATFINGVVTASNGLNINASNDIKLGGTLTEATTTIATGTNDLAITGLEDVSTTFDSTTQNIVVMGTDGVLKLTSAQSLVNDAIDEGNLTAKTLSGNGITVTAGNTVGTDVSVASSLLKDVTLGIADNAITTDKILDGTIGTVDLADGAVTNTKITGGGSGEIMISDASGNVTWVNPNTLLASISDGNTTVVSGTGTTTDPYIVEVKDGSINTIHLTNGAVTNAKVGADAITTDKILDGTIGTVDLADGAVTNAKITGGGAGEIMISDASGNVTWVNPNTLLASISDGNTTVVSGTGTTTDPYIVEVKDGSINTIHLTNGAVTNAKVGADAITTDKILDGTILSDDIANKTIQVSDIADAGNNQVLVTGATGEAAWIDQSNLGNTTTADNGLTKTGNNVQLGGALITPTVITADATNTLAIAGLQNSAANSAAIVLADENTGILRKVARSLEYTTGADFTVASQTGYNKFVQEITILANIGSDDIDITLPPAADAKGQVINVKIANTNEPDAYVNIPGVDGVTIYGSMPYQGWIIKSNGSTWSLVGRI